MIYYSQFARILKGWVFVDLIEKPISPILRLLFQHRIS